MKNVSIPEGKTKLSSDEEKLLTYEILTAPYRHPWETYEKFKEREKTMKKALKLYLKGKK